jgi:hypothetical protein
MDAEINNVIYMELYSGAKMVDDKCLKTNNVRSIDRDSTVLGNHEKPQIGQTGHLVITSVKCCCLYQLDC